ncbi:MAG: hypothetical protein ORN54_09370, partial [Cyclobacteriaceae bacterium]|nr:hypothetical protein [Cyclobacteriaceae bacterium]
MGVRIDKDFPLQTLAQALESNSFDLVFLNYGNGSDDIKRNAYLLENVIQWVNQQTAAAGSTQKNIVVGVSMGGLVSRYALRDMEVRNVNHNTRLYASIDSPHQGANIPLGFQAAIRFMGGLKFLGVSLAGANPELQRGIKALNSPAATQMITYQLSGQGNAITLNNAPYLNFMNEYRNMGLPRQWGIRTLAVASGSECGITQGFAPNSVMLSGNGSQDLNYFLAIYASFIVDGPLGFFESFFSTDTELRADLTVRALPNQEVKPIFNTRIRYTKEVLFGLYTTSTDLINFTFNSTANLLPLDSNPGGKFDVNNFATIPTNISFINLNLTQSVFSFIPTTSSLDVGGGAQPITNTDYLRAYSPTAPPAAPKNIPFNNFFSNPLANENHVQLTKQNGNWLLQEALGTPAFYSCSYQCAGTDILPSINFPSLVCANSTPLSINNYASGSSISWSSNTAGLSISPGTINNTTATRVNNFNGQVTITATVNSPCGSVNVSPLTISVGSG